MEVGKTLTVFCLILDRVLGVLSFLFPVGFYNVDMGGALLLYQFFLSLLCQFLLSFCSTISSVHFSISLVFLRC